MISAIISPVADDSGLAATLSSLTTAAIDGFVREVIVSRTGAGPLAIEIAEDSGARLVDGDQALACATARQPWLLLLPAGARLQIGWEPAARAHISRYPERAGWFQLNYAADGLGARLAEAWVNGLARTAGAPRPQQGLLVASRLWAAKAARGLTYRPLEARILAGGLDFD